MIYDLGDLSDQEKMILSNKQIRDFSILPKIMHTRNHLKTLDLSNNDIHTQKSVSQIFRMINMNETIETLILRNCKINTQGLNHICNHLALSTNKNLKFLDIRDNPIPDPQLKMLLALL